MPQTSSVDSEARRADVPDKGELVALNRGGVVAHARLAQRPADTTASA